MRPLVLGLSLVPWLLLAAIMALLAEWELQTPPAAPSMATSTPTDRTVYAGIAFTGTDQSGVGFVCLVNQRAVLYPPMFRMPAPPATPTWAPTTAANIRTTGMTAYSPANP